MRSLALSMGCVAVALYLGGCSAGGQTLTDADQKAAEGKYSQQAYEDAMKANGRQKELDEQKKIEADRKAAMARDGGSGDR